jgi:predicted transcriptional regulator
VATLVGSLKAIADEKTLMLFNAIATEGGNTETLRKKAAFSRKQYYMRISILTKAGLIRRTNGIYSLTSLGKIVYSAKNLIEEAVDNYWKLKAIDSIESSEYKRNAFSREERRKILDSLIDKDSEIKDILLNT